MKRTNVCTGGGHLVYRNGFTLIELLAVIVILAIIALIATPIILNIIDSSKRQSVLRSGELYLDGVKDEIARKNLTSEFSPEKCEIQSDGNLLCDGEEIIIETSGQRPSKGSITLEKGKITEVKDMVLGDYTLETDENKKLRIKEGNSTEELACKVTYPITTPNVPEIKDGLTPVKWNGSAWEVTTEDDPDWYDYSKQEWANAVILNEGVTKTSGQKITVPTSTDSTTEVRAMLVWIPRYEYRIEGEFGKCGDSAELPGAIDINFIPVSTKSPSTSEYHVHPAFTFGEEDLSGIWIGKFETTGTKENPTILPNLLSLTDQRVGEQFETAKNLEVSGYDSHMAKNSEWGAVAYLSQSIYGKYGNSNYEGANKEVYKNDSGDFDIHGSYYAGYTGRSSGEPPASGYSATGTCTYDNKTPGTEEDATALCGEGASTTGNITGVYDMSGGAWEHVMGYLEDINGSLPWGSTPIDNQALFSAQPDSKYYDAYTTGDPTTACNGVCYGHALGETGRWYTLNSSIFITGLKPWLVRGGTADSEIEISDDANVFVFSTTDGIRNSDDGFRVVLVAA